LALFRSTRVRFKPDRCEFLPVAASTFHLGKFTDLRGVSFLGVPTDLVNLEPPTEI